MPKFNYSVRSLLQEVYANFVHVGRSSPKYLSFRTPYLSLLVHTPLACVDYFPYFRVSQQGGGILASGMAAVSKNMASWTTAASLATWFSDGILAAGRHGPLVGHTLDSSCVGRAHPGHTTSWRQYLPSECDQLNG